ncbi:GGDEF domain-containing protein [Acidicapsa ligni]|uniref:GGDEF domain-containing protein n=1 Tax=Acidicapsa ligni TaxID=542300 RepID=UPI0021E08D5F|nr:diguanylate cyclase [Acidicapsa ligni]
MSSRPAPTLKVLLLFSAAFVFLHVLSFFVFPGNVMAASYPFLILGPIAALAACCWRAINGEALVRRSWILVCIGFLLWNVGMLGSAWEDVFQNAPVKSAYFSDFLYFVYGAPLLLAISSPAEDQGIRVFFWLDVIQVGMTAYLSYVEIFSVAPFLGGETHPMPEPLVLLTYNIENLVLALVVLLRLVASPRGGDERRFYTILGSFLWPYCGIIWFYNWVVVATENHAGFYDLLIDLPFLLLMVLALRDSARESTGELSKKSSLGLFIDNASPIFFTLAMLALGFVIMREHFYIGVAAILSALCIYGIRATLIQSRFMQAQQALQEARDRLEEMSLKDGLTGVANRRCFDQTLESEWNRANRSYHPISLLMVDVDYFKNLNDTHGHRVGDGCLKQIATALSSVLPRKGDLLARYGGEEFAVILPATDRMGAEVIVERMQAAVRALNIKNVTSIGHYATVSIGVAVFNFPQECPATALVEASDRALYRAKENGRNRVEFASTEPLFGM